MKEHFFMIQLDLLVYYLGMAFQTHVFQTHMLKPCIQTVDCDKNWDWEVLKKKKNKSMEVRKEAITEAFA